MSQQLYFYFWLEQKLYKGWCEHHARTRNQNRNRKTKINIIKKYKDFTDSSFMFYAVFGHEPQVKLFLTPKALL